MEEKLNLLFVDMDKITPEDAQKYHDLLDEKLGATIMLPKDLDVLTGLSLSQLFSLRDAINYYINLELKKEGYFDPDEKPSEEELDEIGEEVQQEELN